jgi:hypothetical protein
MIFIDGVLISEEITKEHFVCNLKACKGACCWEGDFGAPVSLDELSQIQQYNEVISPFLNQASQANLALTQGFEYYEDAGSYGTALNQDASCVYLAIDENGVGACIIEKLYTEGLIPVNKPMSCHLYPIRVTKNEGLGFEAWNYDEWDICSAACSLGDELKIPIYKFLKSAIVRYKGTAFYQALEAAANSPSNV